MKRKSSLLKTFDISERNLLFMIIGGSFLFRLLLILLWNHEVFWDSSVYIGIGKYFFSGGATGIYEVFRPPLLPLMLGFFWWFNISPVIAGYALMLAASTASVYLCYLIAKDIMDCKAGLLTAFLVAVSPAMVFYSTTILSGVISLFFILLACYLVLKGNNYLWIGLLAGAAFLTRFPTALLLFALLFFILIDNVSFDIRKIRWKSLFTKSSLLCLGFALFTIPYFIYIHLNYGHPFFGLKEGSAVITLVGRSLGDGILFYPLNIFIDSAFAVLALGGIYFLFRKFSTPERSRRFVWFIFALSFLLFAYFSYIAKKEMRYMVIVLPFIFMMAVYGLNTLRLRRKIKRYVLIALLVIVCIQSVGGVISYDKMFGERMDSEIQDNYYKQDTEGLVVTSGPITVAYQDAKPEVIYWTRPGMFEYYEDHSPSMYKINTCELFCPEGDITCTDAKKEFIDRLKQNYVVSFEKERGRCTYYVFS